MATCRTQEENIFSAENIRNCEQYVFSIQQRLDRAIATNNVKRIRHILDLLTKRSKAVKILATYRITIRNQGKYTAGIDGISIPKGNKALADKIKMELLESIDIKAKPNTIKRVFIPKGNGKKRPLGIPTIKDRINQEILRTALEPIVEYYSHDNSFGFRPKRSCHDAIELLFSKLSSKNRSRYIVEGDIKGCFDNISHTHITKTLNAWNVPEQYTDLIDSILKTKVFHNGHVYDNDTGTPQGGVISPMLANVALTGLDNFIEENFFTGYNKRRVNPMVRYADDFVITCVSKTKAVEIKKAVSQYLSENIGLTLSESKSKITHIKKGFNFLGFNIRKYLKHKNKHKPEKSIDDYVLLIKPQKVKIQGFLKEFSNVLTENKTATQSNLIHLLNPKVIGWANYYRYVVSSEIFSDIDDIIWEKVLRWANRRHSNKNKGWIMRKYFLRLTDTRNLTFRDKLTKTTLKRLYPILSKKRYTKNKGGMRVYSTENAEYWEKREYLKTLSQFFLQKGTTFI